MITSPFLRTFQTAVQVAKELQLEVYVDHSLVDELREATYGPLTSFSSLLRPFRELTTFADGVVVHEQSPMVTVPQSWETDEKINNRLFNLARHFVFHPETHGAVYITHPALASSLLQTLIQRNDRTDMISRLNCAFMNVVFSSDENHEISVSQRTVNFLAPFRYTDGTEGWSKQNHERWAQNFIQSGALDFSRPLNILGESIVAYYRPHVPSAFVPIMHASAI